MTIAKKLEFVNKNKVTWSNVMYDHIATLVAQRFACVGEPDP